MIKDVNITISNKKGSLYETQINLGKHSSFKLPSVSKSSGVFGGYTFPYKGQILVMASLSGLHSIINVRQDVVNVVKERIK
jgi:hypothetical protein